MTSVEDHETRMARKIRVALVEREMDQKDLAEMIGIERATLNRYLRGHVSMNMRTFIRLAEALGVAPSDLLK